MAHGDVILNRHHTTHMDGEERRQKKVNEEEEVEMEAEVKEEVEKEEKEEKKGEGGGEWDEGDAGRRQR